MAAKPYKKNVGGDWEWTLDPVKAVLVDRSLHTPNLASDEFLSDIAAGARIAISPALTGKTRTLGVLDANDVTFTAVSGPSAEMLVLFIDTGNPATSRLLFNFDDTAPATVGLPVSPNGGDIVMTWDNGPNKIVNLDYVP